MYDVPLALSLYIYMYMYEGEWKSNTLFFSTGIITDTGTYTIPQNEAGPMWITSLLLNIVTISLDSNVSPLNESMCRSHVKFCGLFFEPHHYCSFHFLVTSIMFRPNGRKFKRQIYSYIYIYICVCVCVCVCKILYRRSRQLKDQQLSSRYELQDNKNR